VNVHALAARSCARDPQDHLAPSPCARRCEESKAEANALFKRGDAARANRRYKKAMLDLEVPTQWAADDNVRRNQLRLALHLNVAACGLRATDVFGETRYHDTISHASRVLEADPSNVKACRALSVKPPVLVPRSLLAVMVVAPSLEARGAACHRRLSFDAVRPTCCGLTTSTASRWRSRRADPPCHPP